MNDLLTYLLINLFSEISDLWDGFVEELFEELELRDVASREASQHVEQQLNLVVVLSAVITHRENITQTIKNKLPSIEDRGQTNHSTTNHTDSSILPANELLLWPKHIQCLPANAVGNKPIPGHYYNYYIRLTAAFPGQPG